MFGFLLRFLVLYLLLMIPWPGVAAWYRTTYVSCGGPVIRALGAGYDLALSDTSDDPKQPDVEFLVPRNDLVPGSEDVRQLALRVNSREVGYLGAAVIVSLILATPLPWRRRLITLAIGLALTCAFVIIRVMPLIAYTRFVDAAILHGAVEPGPTGLAVAAVAKFVGFGQPISYIVPIVLWMLLAMRRDVLARLLPDLAVGDGRGDPARTR